MSTTSWLRPGVWCIAASLVCLVLSGIAACQSAPLTDPPGFHLSLRSENGRTTYKLGEPIELELSCNSDLTQRYTSLCADRTGDGHSKLEVVALDPRSKLALDPVERRWIGRALCPYAQYLTDNMTGEPAFPPVSAEVRWWRVTVLEHYPMSAGRFRVRAITSGAVLPGKQMFTATSAPVEIEVVDDPQWRAAVLREAMQTVRQLSPLAPASASNAEYAKVAYMPDLEVLHWLISEDGYAAEVEVHPDRAAVARFLREYLDRHIEPDSSLFRETVEAVLALELAEASPRLYARAVKFQDAEGPPSSRDLGDLRAWLLPRYRRLILEIARSMVTTHKQSTDTDTDSNLEFKAEDLVEINVPDCNNTRPFLSASELRGYMRAAGLSARFIDEQMANMRASLTDRPRAK